MRTSNKEKKSFRSEHVLKWLKYNARINLNFDVKCVIIIFFFWKNGKQKFENSLRTFSNNKSTGKQNK